MVDMVQSDIIFTLKQKEHNVFRRVGNNLYINLDITLQDAVLGFTKQIRHLDGRYVDIKSNEGEVVQPFSWKVLKDEGMPIRGTGDFGELHVKMIVNFPKELTDKQKQLVELIFAEN